MMTDLQLICLLNYVRCEASRYAQFIPCPEHEVIAARRDLCEAFGFKAHKNGYPITPAPHPQTLPPADGPAYHPLSEPAWAASTTAADKAYAICKSCGEQFRLSQGHTCTGIAAKPVVCSNCGQIMGANHVCTAATNTDPDKHERITKLLVERKALNFTYPQKAADIMSLWPELKAIMEPHAVTITDAEAEFVRRCIDNAHDASSREDTVVMHSFLRKLRGRG